MDEFNAVNAVAYDLYRANSERDHTVPPCWLCMSEEKKEEARQDLFAFIRLTHDLTDEEITQFLKLRIPQSKIDKWQEVEEKFLERRNSGNFAAFFAD